MIRAQLPHQACLISKIMGVLQSLLMNNIVITKIDYYHVSQGSLGLVPDGGVGDAQLACLFLRQLITLMYFLSTSWGYS